MSLTPNELNFHRGYGKGSNNAAKQVLDSAYHSMSIRVHNVCAPRMKITTHTTKRSADNLVYQYEDGRYHFFEVERTADDHVYGRRFKLAPYRVAHVQLPWSKIGVFRSEGLEDVTFCLKRSELDGKAVLAGDVLTTCPRNVLFDY